MDNTKWMQNYVRKHHFSVLTHLNPVSQPMKTPTKSHDFCIIFYFLFDRFSKNGSF